jgi:hypothetical protein
MGPDCRSDACPLPCYGDEHRDHFGEVPGSRTRAGDDLLAGAIVKFMRHLQRLLGGPSETGSA